MNAVWAQVLAAAIGIVSTLSVRVLERYLEDRILRRRTRPAHALDEPRTEPEVDNQ